MRPAPMLLAVGLCLPSCAIFGKGGDTAGAGGPAPVGADDDDEGADEDDESDGPETDIDTDADTDVETDTDGDTDTDTDPDALDCSQRVTPPTGIDACVDTTLRCGDRIIGTTQGAASRWGEDAYVNWYCFPLPDGDYAGGEVVYDFQHPGDKNVEITLESPCDELDVLALRWAFWDADGECPSENSTLASDCTADDSRGDGTITLPEIPDGTPYHYLVVVEGPEPVDTLYRLTVDCQ
ncbi:MAG: hypothetical protein VX265_02995 [Myxococcota bacterium]|nr:hypothetical protein [Myxococcota bacterium]